MTDIFSCISEMEERTSSHDWAGLEEHFTLLCEQMAGPKQRERIAAVDLSGYQLQLRASLEQSLKRVNDLPARAIYFEYDLDNDWQSGLFLCRDYAPASSGSDDWAADWIEVIDGPALPEFGAIYREHGFGSTESAKGSTLYLIARTVASFGRAAEGLQPGGIAVCLGYHDQDRLFRVHEPNGR